MLLKPPFNPGNALLWLTPFAIVLGGGAILVLRARKPPATLPLSAEEEAALAELNIAEPVGPGQGSAA